MRADWTAVRVIVRDDLVRAQERDPRTMSWHEGTRVTVYDVMTGGAPTREQLDQVGLLTPLEALSDLGNDQGR